MNGPLFLLHGCYPLLHDSANIPRKNILPVF
jgi:hypothetical protein